MAATVGREAPHRYLAWCGECYDGVRSDTKTEPNEWAMKHNRDKHQREL